MRLLTLFLTLLCALALAGCAEDYSGDTSEYEKAEKQTKSTDVLTSCVDLPGKFDDLCSFLTKSQSCLVYNGGGRDENHMSLQCTARNDANVSRNVQTVKLTECSRLSGDERVCSILVEDLRCTLYDKEYTGGAMECAASGEAPEAGGSDEGGQAGSEADAPADDPVDDPFDDEPADGEDASSSE